MMRTCRTKPKGWVRQTSEHSAPRALDYAQCVCVPVNHPSDHGNTPCLKGGLCWPQALLNVQPFAAPCPVCLILCTHGDTTFL